LHLFLFAAVCAILSCVTTFATEDAVPECAPTVAIGPTVDHDLRRRRWERYDIDRLTKLPWTANGVNYDVYGNANFSVVVTNACNAKCKFCVQELKYERSPGEFNTSSSAGTKDNNYFASLDRALTAVKPLNPSLAITGGEATMDPRLPRILQILASHGVRKRVLTTNGTYLMRKMGGSPKTVLEHLIDYKLEHLNVSRAHWDRVRNAELMLFPEVPGSDDDFIEALRLAKAAGIRPRLSVVLLKEGVGSLETMKKYLDWAASIGVDNVVFRQLMLFDKKTTAMDSVALYSEEQRAPLEPILDRIDGDQDFKFIKQVLGYYYYVEVYRYKGIDVVCEIADLAKIDEEDEKIRSRGGKKKVYEFVFHPNGSLNSSWKEWQGELLPPVSTLIPLGIR